jgi:hypothetical protein
MVQDHTSLKAAPAELGKEVQVKTSDFTLYTEAFRGLTFIHCDVHVPWSLCVKRALGEAFEALRARLQTDLYALHEPLDHKHKKFLSLYGFKPQAIWPRAEKPYVIYVRKQNG